MFKKDFRFVHSRCNENIYYILLDKIFKHERFCYFMACKNKS